MSFEQVSRTAQELGLLIEEHDTGFRLYDVDGRLLGSQLAYEQVEVFVMGRRTEKARERQQAVANSSPEFPPR